VTTGCIQLQVAPATLNRTSGWSAGRSQGRRQPARSRARTLDGELARRLSTPYSDTQLNCQPADLDCLSDKVPSFTHNAAIADKKIDDVMSAAIFIHH
jgi:hypothetical protein